MNREKVLNELETVGYSVVPGVLTGDECDAYVSEYKKWLAKFGDDFPHRDVSLIHQFRIAHAEPTWNVRKKSKHVFASIWGTEALLTSMDGIAIGEPPELGRSTYCNPESFWFHTDQGSWREGLHAYQGAVYLEATTETDFCFRVLEGSHRFHQEFCESFPKAREEMEGSDFYRLSKEQVDWYLAKGCNVQKVPVPKGGIVLWDSRTIHDNIRPVLGRKNSDRWRFVVFVCMVPAFWSSKEELELKKLAYDEMIATGHWPSQGVWLFLKTNERELTKRFHNLEMVDEQPPIARELDVLKMVGIKPYEEGLPCPDFTPKWKVDFGSENWRNRRTKQKYQ